MAGALERDDGPNGLFVLLPKPDEVVVDCPKGVAGEDRPKNGTVPVALEAEDGGAPNMLDDNDGALPNGLLEKELEPKLL